MPTYYAREEYNPETIRRILRARGLGAEDVARRSRGALSPNFIRNLLKGTNPTARTEKLETLARLLHVPMETLQK
jgi:transcriptional regulator with XRE-family HTH domain